MRNQFADGCSGFPLISKISQFITFNTTFYSVQFNLNLVHYPYTLTNENRLTGWWIGFSPKNVVIYTQSYEIRFFQECEKRDTPTLYKNQLYTQIGSL